ncbi:MAG TPA: DUF5682 family protein [Stellaceae bacterium]|nr:DUF5682 family protein [Stellaceae bacterium]
MDKAAVSRFTERLLAAERSVHFFPIRHHSPACAVHLTRAFREIRPKLVLIEMPSDFSHLIPLLADPALRPPAAIVAMPGRRQTETASSVAYWPISATAPEYAAIRAATACEAAIQFFDLASFERGEAGLVNNTPIILTDDRRLDHSNYGRALIQRTGCRDFNELWDRLFEAKLAEPDWRRFFADVGTYCLLARQTYAGEELERDGTLARERYMAARLASAIGTTDGVIAVVTGGLHTSALLDPPKETGISDPKGRQSRSYLVRFSHQRLDALNGYAAGMPNPRYYELLFAAAERGEANPFKTSAEEVFLDLTAHLRSVRPGFAPSVPAIVEALRHATTLADLRGLPGPLRSEVFDAARAALLKDEDPRFGSPLMEELAMRLTGTGIGDVPLDAGSPPLVEAARRQARSLGFSVTDSITRRRDLDIHRNERHREASRFVHAMTVIGAEFARLEQGADYAAGIDLDTLFEIWSYAWSPLVEARLIEAGADGDDVERACAACLRRRATKLAAGGRGRNAAEAANLLLSAARSGVTPVLLRELLHLLEGEISQDSELSRVSTALRTLFLLWCSRPVLNLMGEPRLGGMLGACYRRAVFLLPMIGATKREQMAQAAQALVMIRDVVDSAGELPEIDPDLFTEAVDDLVETELPPLLHGAVATLSVQFGRRSTAFLASRMAGALAGTAVEAADRVAPIAGLLMVSPASLRRMDEVVAAIDQAICDLDEPEFVQLLPHLRSAFTDLAPGEAEALSASIASHHGLTPHELEIHQPIPLSEAELHRNIDISREFERLWREDGLGAWLDAGARG